MVRLSARDYFDAGGQFFPWVMAMSVGGCCLDIDSFDQSNDEASSVPARMMVGENRGRATVTGELSRPCLWQRLRTNRGPGQTQGVMGSLGPRVTN